MISHFHFKSVDSTQDQAFRLINSGVKLPFLVTTDLQTKGRGRAGREWASEPGRSLCFSLAVQLPSKALLGLSLAVGFFAYKYFEIPEIKLKWPNDLMLEDSKIGGILIESRSNADRADVCIGLGINLFDLLSSPYKGLKKKINAAEMTEFILNSLTEYEALGFSKYRDAFERQMWKLGEEAVLRVDGVATRVQVNGVSSEGLLVTKTQGELKVSDQGEIIHG